MGALPFIHTLEFHFEGFSWWTDEDGEAFYGFGEPKAPFWEGLKKNCPRLHTLTLTNIGDSDDNRWLEESGLFEIENIRNLTLRFSQSTLTETGNQKLLQTVSNLAPRLRTLNLAPNSDTDEWMKMENILDFTFPHLESLTLSAYVLEDTAKAMAFWERHPTLEYINLSYGDETPRFAEGVHDVVNFLPNLRHLVAPFRDVRNLSPLLPQLISLTILDSINAQVPYLLRSVLQPSALQPPNSTGTTPSLPILQSLNIIQDGEPYGKISHLEGSHWYETAEGEFKEAPEKKGQKFKKSVLNGYMHSIVRAAPNLVELGLQASGLDVSNYDKLIPDLAQLKNLQRFCYRDQHTHLSDLDSDQKEEFKSKARLAAEACPRLTMVADIYADPPARYVTARILRKLDDGSVDDVELVTGDGMVIGQEDQAFPRSSEASLV
ncbi:hypothetical protein CC2G_009665 [Coprinopsis cinerea AmutBmut pab1-1]|nr:hypothetical protein CC2G_009665 [Coprinopsis cinerea AmutBmut pab1-1]